MYMHRTLHKNKILPPKENLYLNMNTWQGISIPVKVSSGLGAHGPSCTRAFTVRSVYSRASEALMGNKGTWPLSWVLKGYFLMACFCFSWVSLQLVLFLLTELMTLLSTFKCVVDGRMNQDTWVLGWVTPEYLRGASGYQPNGGG